MNELLKRYLETKGKHHTDINLFFCEIMNETKGNILQSLVDNEITDFRQLNQFLVTEQLKKIREENPEMY
jgi:hypothetical protein